MTQIYYIVEWRSLFSSSKLTFCYRGYILLIIVKTKGYQNLSGQYIWKTYVTDILLLLPKYVNLWGALTLQRFNDYMDSNDTLGTTTLVKEIVIFFIILGAHRKQALFMFSTSNITFRENKVICFLTKL